MLNKILIFFFFYLNKKAYFIQPTHVIHNPYDLIYSMEKENIFNNLMYKSFSPFWVTMILQ